MSRSVQGDRRAAAGGSTCWRIEHRRKVSRTRRRRRPIRRRRRACRISSRYEAAGEHLLNLHIGLPMSELRSSVRSAMIDEGYENVLTLDAVNRKGRRTRIRVVVGALRSPRGSTEGVILVMEPDGQPGSPPVT
jgi:hypothetical protein